MAETVQLIIQNPVALAFSIIFIFLALGLLAMAVIKQGRGVDIGKGGIKISEGKTIVTSSKNEANPEKSGEIYKIEGIWGDWSGTVEEPRASFVHITRNGVGFAINGKEFDENYKKMGDWASDVSKFRKLKKRLEYLFEATGSFTGDEVVNVNGYTSITFYGDEDKIPETYSGTYVDVINPATGELRSGSFEGKRLTKKEKDYYLGEPEEQRFIIDKLIRNAKIRAKAILDAEKKSKERAEE